MHRKIWYSFLIIYLIACKVQCEENISKQTFIYSHGLAKVNFYTKKEWSYIGCMEHCKKLGSRSPSVRTLQELSEMEGIVNDLLAFTPSPDLLYLSATRGKVKYGKDGEYTLPLEHWPQDIAESEKGVWRDYYTGAPLENYNRTWVWIFSHSTEKIGYCALLAGNTLEANKPPFYKHTSPLEWGSIDCSHTPSDTQIWCPCLHEKPLLLRGACSSSNLRNFGTGLEYKPHHMPVSYDSVFFESLGESSSRIDYNLSSSRWVYSSKIFQTTAFSEAENETYLLGKYNWTVSNDQQRCHREKGKEKFEDYDTELKLTGCHQGFFFDGKMIPDTWSGLDAEFTCNDGQCVRMEERCDQLSDCRDGSDEKGCNLLILDEGYSKNVPPFTKTRTPDKPIIPVPVQVNMTLLQVVNINDEENTIELQFEITMKWKDSRITFNNLKREIFLNALTEEDMNKIWLPLIVYSNTHQKETTRLGWITEWSTSVTVAREGSFER